MHGTGFTGRLARVAARHPWRILGVWLVVLAVAVVFAGGIGDALTEDGDLTVIVESEQADDLIAAHFPSDGAPPREFVIVESDGATVGDSGFDAAVAAITAELGALDTTGAVTSHLDGVPGLVSEDGTVALVLVDLAFVPGESSSESVVAAVAEAGNRLDVSTSVIGNGSVNAEFSRLADETLVRGELLGLSAALVILLFVFGAAVAAGIPLVLAIVSIAVAVGLAAVVGQFVDLSIFVVNMITMIGLAVGIDYSLFIVQRFREERAHGLEVVDAVERAGESAARAVFFSGATVVIALVGLLYMPDTVMRSLGLGAILVVVASVAAALTLLPATLGLLGDRVDRFRVPFLNRTQVADGGSRFWHRVTALVTGRPIVAMVLAGGLLLAAAAPYVTLRTGQNGIDSLPDDSSAKHAFTVLNEEFETGTVTTYVVVDGSTTDPALLAAVANLEDALGADATYGEVTTTPSPDGEVMLIEAVTKLDPSTTEARDAVATLRAEIIPSSFAGTGAAVYVTGDAAWTADYVDLLNSRTPTIFVFVLGLSFLLLMVVFRSIVVPLKAIVMNLLSVGAAYGLLVLVFQHGVGADVFGFQRTDVIEAWIPLFLFTVLFGLSMDYHIFLLSRIKERYDVTGDNDGSVAFGLGSTGAIITGAALIMVAVFGGFAAGDLVMFQQMGFGLAVAVILDATIIRTVLVPATMKLLGDRNWYFPSWLRWVPEIHIEGRPRPSVPATPAVEDAVA